VLNREPMGMKPPTERDRHRSTRVSVLNREPMGMKRWEREPEREPERVVSVLNREPMGMKHASRNAHGGCNREFQCSTASRWG